MSVSVAGYSLAVLAVALIGPVPALLARARWTHREPRAALVCWQAIGLSGGLALLGSITAMALAPLGGGLLAALGTWVTRLAGGDLTGGLGTWHQVLLVATFVVYARLVGVLAATVYRTWNDRRRHRDLVDLVADPWPTGRPGNGHVLQHPGAAAYCLPGRAPRVVITSGALDALDDAELRAVLAHEDAHLRERHDLVALPFAAWTRALPWFPGIRRARSAVDSLLEMVADDTAVHRCERNALASALARIATIGGAATPDGAFASTGGTTLARVRRLLDPPERSGALRAVLYGTAALLFVLPALVLL
ncbi:M56 family metallopeptidase [Phytomonospora sp. NPDC050363]|uniref:M56 family metallopeptidase n=1 Tax=Phytomonospora sp. NPDC050363 TaxID=3155642 RepID=UPI0033C4FE05